MTQYSYETECGDIEVEEITAVEEQRRLDDEARRVLNISGAEFERRWLAGDFREHDDPRVAQLAFLVRDAW